MTYEVYSVDSTESREKKSGSKILPQAGLDLRTSDFQVLLSATACWGSSGVESRTLKSEI